ncbi:MAG: hypothetical protein KAS12_01910, partial [Candidatus Aenigmarchaeota archaeon]|nr:hypothetical protein [Candidatus Aenigmarchaeota archaeon]
TPSSQDIENDPVTYVTNHTNITWNGTALVWQNAIYGSHTVEIKANDGNLNSTPKTIQITVFNLHEIPLINGWNLISIPTIPKNTTIESILESINNNYTDVFAWNASAGNWLSYTKENPGSTLTNIDNTMGFWIQMNNTDTLEIIGTKPTTTQITLIGTNNTNGWNLIGYPSLTQQTPQNVLSSIINKYDKISTYYDSLWTTDIPKLYPHTQLIEYMKPNAGYWIRTNTTTDTTLTYN